MIKNVIIIVLLIILIVFCFLFIKEIQDYPLGLFISTNWDKLLYILIAVWGIYTYIDSRRRELAWHRTELLFSQAEHMDTDEDISKAVKIIEGRHSKIKLDNLFNENGEPQDEYNDDLQIIDKLLNLLDRIAHATYTLGTLTIDETSNFGWYFKKVVGNERCKNYCNDNGFKDVVKLGLELQKKNSVNH